MSLKERSTTEEKVVDKEDTKGTNSDPGNEPYEYFRQRMSPLRFAMREYLVQFTKTQSKPLAEWQRKVRTPARDIFFEYTAFLGAHMFYVIFLPVPVWLGQYHLTGDMVYVLAYSIYLSGLLKDYWCLPRPESPPLMRLSLSKSTTKEYGAPSSHTANATGVSLLFFLRIWQATSISSSLKLSLLILVVVYYFTLVLGRLYCGMHGLLDLISGALSGLICFLGTLFVNWYCKSFDYGQYLWYPILIFAWGFFILDNHVRPVDYCPCYEDSVSFIGVVGGWDFGDWIIRRYNFTFALDIGLNKNDIPTVVIKLLVGILCVIIWMYAISKPLINGTIGLFTNLKEKHNRSKAVILARYVRYAGIPMTVTLVAPMVFHLLNII